MRRCGDMNKRMKKQISLNKETLRKLADRELDRAAAGAGFTRSWLMPCETETDCPACSMRC